MSIFEMMNYLAWVLCVVVAYLLIRDVIKVEKKKRKEKEEKNES